MAKGESPTVEELRQNPRARPYRTPPSKLKVDDAYEREQVRSLLATTTNPMFKGFKGEIKRLRTAREAKEF